MLITNHNGDKGKENFVTAAALSGRRRGVWRGGDAAPAVVCEARSTASLRASAPNEVIKHEPRNGGEVTGLTAHPKDLSNHQRPSMSWKSYLV